MKAKVIIAQATAETAETLYGLVKKMMSCYGVSLKPIINEFK